MTKIKASALNDIEWPKRPMQGDPMRLKFASALTELMSEAKINPIDLAVKVFGRDPKTNSPLQAEAIRAYRTGDKFPTPENAAKIAKALSVPISRLVTPNGPLISPTAKVVRTAGSPGGRAALALPEGAPPLTFKLEDYKPDARFAMFSVSGVTEIDTALAIFGLVQGK